MMLGTIIIFGLLLFVMIWVANGFYNLMDENSSFNLMGTAGPLSITDYKALTTCLPLFISQIVILSLGCKDAYHNIDLID